MTSGCYQIPKTKPKTGTRFLISNITISPSHQAEQVWNLQWPGWPPVLWLWIAAASLPVLSQVLKKIFTLLPKAMSASSLFFLLQHCSSALSQKNKLIARVKSPQKPCTSLASLKTDTPNKQNSWKRQSMRVIQGLTWKKQGFRKRTLILNEEQILLSTWSYQSKELKFRNISNLFIRKLPNRECFDFIDCIKTWDLYATCVLHHKSRNKGWEAATYAVCTSI